MLTLPEPTQGEVKARVTYDPLTGKFYLKSNGKEVLKPNSKWPACMWFGSR